MKYWQVGAERMNALASIFQYAEKPQHNSNQEEYEECPDSKLEEEPGNVEDNA